MPLLLHRAVRADQLIDGLAELLATPLPDPFAQELVLVPARGVERWLSQRLSHRLGAATADGAPQGVCAGVQFRSPHSLVAEVTGTRDDDVWAPDALVWPLLAVVDAHAGESWCRALSEHLGHGEVGEEGELRRGRRYAVARRLARLFASYATQRPSLLADWEAGRDTDGAGRSLDTDLTWQPELWRLLSQQVAAPTPGQRHARVLETLRTDPGAVDLPERFSLFGHTRIPVTEVELLAALGAQRDVHLWLPHPSEALWQALRDEHGAVPRDHDDSHTRVGHPLLASLGRDTRELQRVVQTAATDAGAAAPPEHPDNLLGWLQHDLAGNATVDPARRTLSPTDASIRVHACHGPARQVEVLREELLGLLADDPTLEPRDILVMCPDIEAYAPLVSAAFGLGESGGTSHPGHQLRVRLADRSLTQTNPLLAVVGQLLDLAGGRAEASRVLDLLAAAPVRRRFGFSDSDLETLTDWIEKAGVRWAFDAEHRAPFGLDDYVQNTWRFGLDRVLAGVAVSDDAQRFFGTTLPLDDVGSTSIDLAGRLAEAIDRIQQVTDQLVGSHPVEHWLEVIGDGVDQLTSVSRDDEWQSGQVHRELASMREDAARDDLDLRLPDVRALMRERLAGRPTRANFRTGTLTVATLVPMRSVPHRVVCLLGLDDGVFPRAGITDGDDVLARGPLTGERDPRSEDRQLMLDAITSATDHLLVTYTGANETTGQSRPPAVPLGELLDALDQTVVGGKDHALVRHPLQAFDPRNFLRSEPRSFDTAALAGARAATAPRVPQPTLDTTRLAPRGGDVELAELVSFFKHPVKEFLRKRLDITLADEGEQVTDGLPVELDGLVRWGVGDRMLRDLLAGRSRDQALAREWRRGVLPPGRLGWRLAQSIADEALPIADDTEAARGGQRMRAVDVDVDLGEGRRLQGTVSDLYGDRVVKVSFSRLGGKHVLEAWIALLALCAARPGRAWTAGAIGRGGRDRPVARCTFGTVDDAGLLLRDLVAIYDAGLSEPLPLPLKTAEAWARARGNTRTARFKAEDAWCRTRYGKENEDAAHVRVWGPGADFAAVATAAPRPGEEYPGETTRLGALASRLWVPVIEREHR